MIGSIFFFTSSFLFNLLIFFCFSTLSSSLLSFLSLSSFCVVLQVYGALTLPAKGEESEDQGHESLSWPWWACLSAMAEDVAMGPGCFSGNHNNLDAARKQPGLSATMRVLGSAEVSVVPAAAAHQHPRGDPHGDTASGPQQEPASLGASR